MGLLNQIFGRRPQTVSGPYFMTLTGYQPAFTDWNGKLYESDLIRASVDCLATHTSKLGVTIQGAAQPKLQTRLRRAPNGWQTWSQMLYRLRTIYELECTAYIVPVYDSMGGVVGICPVLPSACEMVDYNGELWLRFKFDKGQTAALPMSEVAVLPKFQYRGDYFGTSNNALGPTMELVNAQNEGIREGIKNGATFRFMARLGGMKKDKDVRKEAERFNAELMQNSSLNGGTLLYPYAFEDMKQIDQKPYVVDAAQMQLIQTNVYNYFHVNADILQAKCYGDAYSAYYESTIEPFAIALSDALTRMLFTETEQAHGAKVFLTSNRLQYMTNADKLKVSAQLVDRGIMNRDEAREIWNLPPIPDGKGQEYIIRGEYKDADERENGEGGEQNEPAE